MATKFNRTRAIVLRRINYGEADRILSLITPQGLVAAIARGSRKAKSKLAGGIEMLCLVELVLAQGKGDLKIVTSARLMEFYQEILADYDRLQFAYKVFEQIEKASRGIDSDAWFAITQEVLEALNQPLADFNLIRAWFYLRLVGELGEPLNLHTDIGGVVLQPNQRYSYDYQNKGLVLDSQGEITAEHIKALRLMMSSSLGLALRIKSAGQISAVLFNISRSHAALD